MLVYFYTKLHFLVFYLFLYLIVLFTNKLYITVTINKCFQYFMTKLKVMFNSHVTLLKRLTVT